MEGNEMIGRFLSAALWFGPLGLMAWVGYWLHL